MGTNLLLSRAVRLTAFSLSCIQILGLHAAGFAAPASASGSLAPVRPHNAPPNVAINTTSSLGSLSVNKTAPLIIDFGKSPVLNISNVLDVARGSAIYAVSTNPSVRTATIEAKNI